MHPPIPIFDVDTHYTEPPDLWTSRAPARFKGKVLHVKRTSKGEDRWFIGSRDVAMTGPSAIDADMKKHYGSWTLPRYEVMARAGTYAPERLAYMDDAGIGTEMVYPNIIGFGGRVLMELTEDAELRLFHVQAYNDAIIDLQNASAKRLLPQAALPLWDLDASLAELARIRKLGLSGIALSSTPQHYGQPPLADPVWDRLFATCQDLDLPINFHIGSGGWEEEVQSWWEPKKSFIDEDGQLNAALTVYTGALVGLGNAKDVCNLIMTGILEKYPRLKFVSVESGCGWLPYMIQNLEHLWSEQMTAKYRARFKRQPKEMFMDQIYCSYWFENSKCVDSFIKEFGPNNLLFETDFPHPASLYPNNLVVQRIEETLGHYEREVQEKVLYKNAERVYGVEVYRPAPNSTADMAHEAARSL